MLTLSDSYYKILQPTFFRIFIDKYWYIQRVTAKIFRKLLPNNSKQFFRTLYQTILTLSQLLQNDTIHFFNTDIFRGFLQNNVTHFSRVQIKQLLKLWKNTDFFRIHTKQYWYIQRVTERDHLTRALKPSYEMIPINFRCNRKSYSPAPNSGGKSVKSSSDRK